MKFIDLIFPKRCVICKKLNSYLCESCFLFLSFDTKSICLICGKRSFNGLTHQRCRGKYKIDGYFSALKLNSVSKKLIYSFKQKQYLLDIKNLLSDLFFESIIQKENFMRQIEKENWIFFFVPLSKASLRKRGYNQAEILAQNLAKKFKFEFATDLSQIRNKNALLVDDIVFSGKTLKEVTKLIKQAGAKKVIGLSLVGK